MKLSIGKCLIAAWGVTLVWLYCKWTNHLDDFYRQQIPAEIQVAELLYADSGIRGACGGVIFELAPQSRTRLSISGLRALSETTPEYAFHTSPGISREWKETPYVYWDDEPMFSETYWALTLSCTWLRDKLRNKIIGALGKPGSFFRRYKEGVTLVIPSDDLVVYLFFD